MTAPLDDWTEEQLALKRALLRNGHTVSMSMGDLFDAISRRNVALAARDAEIARLREALADLLLHAGKVVPALITGAQRHRASMLEEAHARAEAALKDPT